MAGAGGPPRKSHTKSRKGCRTCKRRHIRCDENFPQCRNCTKHNCRCDYMDIPAAGEEPLKGSKPPDLLMSPELQSRLDNWRITGEPPLSELQTRDKVYWTRFSTIDLRLIHHIVTLSTDMHTRGYSSCTVWGSKIGSLISAALSYDFAMSALLALSASHLAWQTKNGDTDNLAYHHRGVALKGLHEAIGAFSRDNSEAILAASILLSWQTIDWRGWASLQQGVSTVMSAMRPWVHESELARYIQDQRALARTATPATPTLPYAQVNVPQEDLSRLDQITAALHNLQMRLSNSEELAEHARHLVEYLQHVQQDMQVRGPEHAFTRLQLLRDFIFWLPPLILRPGESDLAPLALLSHLYASAIVIEPLFPEIGGAYLGSMSVLPLECVHDVLRTRRTTQPQDSGLQVAVSLTDVPAQILTSFRMRQRHNSQGGQAMEMYRYSPQGSPYITPSMPISSPTAELTTVYSHSPLHGSGALQQAPSSAYYANTVGSGDPRRDPSISSLVRAHSMNERNMSAGSPHAMGLVYGASTAQYPRSSHEIPGSRMDYFGQVQAPYNQYGGMNMNTRFVAPSQLWT
ncbi:hypothetical protein LTR10_013704 [Elasticomyces elasticus]|uniref:Zn(2)-C6 fungal-type domain-containing protein n=1 Tax=Exophiala sideris TaxID=1016849 RepID=A0ABR0JGW2_9EURO|nr:hypothetical protein LTR10_013704 [Elasticomyces elasticus]KAK5033321.1 hypothetical protein LTS07_003623 [Exophiala sideris]KAK5042182.1 hypothetical protein LTR13_001988 [Exophiala sideris]KAK5063865.1 hypothetical protein LTR69_003631 [Exophiala sideris]KAK5185450.1 hypothetical protein LTR44_002439 [Eurotiomycetes sp. CCFEE 6388]